MPVFEMPLEEMKSYLGRNPRPADFDEYWDKGLAEMRSLDAKVELIPHDLRAGFVECFELYFTGVGGARVHAKYLRPKGVKEPHPAVLMFHGYSGSSGDWSDKLNYVAQGFSVAALDCRGHVLVLLSEDEYLDQYIYLSCRNIPNLTLREAPHFSIRDVLWADRIIITQEALEQMGAGGGTDADA